MPEITRILGRVTRGEEDAANQLANAVYEELRNLARLEMRGQRSDHTLQPTALVNEAYLRLLHGDDSSFENRAHFFSAAASAIRRVLVDHARKRACQKRGGGYRRVNLDPLPPRADIKDERLILLDEALKKLAIVDPTKARLVELRFLAGLTESEAAQTLGVSRSTVARDWRLLRAWLHRELSLN